METPGMGVKASPMLDVIVARRVEADLALARAEQARDRAQQAVDDALNEYEEAGATYHEAIAALARGETL